jgi:hypothetical protein
LGKVLVLARQKEEEGGRRKEEAGMRKGEQRLSAPKGDDLLPLRERRGLHLHGHLSDELLGLEPGAAAGEERLLAHPLSVAMGGHIPN